MVKKCAILGVIFLLLGGGAFAWVYNETRTQESQASDPALENALQSEEYLAKYGRWYQLSPEEQNQLVLELDNDRQTKTRDQLVAEQQARLRADLDKLAAGEMNVGDIAEFLYGEGWQDEVRKYKDHKEQMEIAQTAAIVSLSIGGAISALCVLVWIVRLFVGLCRAAKRRCSRPTADEQEEPLQASELTDIPFELPDTPADDPKPATGQRRRLGGGSPSAPESSPTPSDIGEDEECFLPRRLGQRVPTKRRSLATEAAAEEHGVALLMSDEPALNQEWSSDMEWSTPDVGQRPSIGVPQACESTSGPAVSVLELEVPTAEPDGALQQQANDLQKQLTELKQVAQSGAEAKQEVAEPLGDTLKDLAQQVSAIRDYAACQQNRVEKLQDGYDWNIIRTFCLRVIRCIDNIETRMDAAGEEDETGIHLEEVRDELLFALESSGVEQFRPELHTAYRGQEKLAEAVKQKDSPCEPDDAGKIAKVVRPGYRYIIDEDSFKVVRTAQVKLFG